MSQCRFRILSWLALGIAAFSGASDAASAGQAANITRAKNVILMIADGSGANAIAATGMYTGKLGKQVYDNADWTKAWVSTYGLRTGGKPIPGPAGLAQDPTAVYDPAKNWDTTPVTTAKGRYPDRFAGYRWSKDTAPDSANTMSAIVTGRKSYDGAINVDGNGTPLISLAELASRAGKAVGVVTTVQISDATPAAGGGAHNVTRDNHTAIAHEMLTSGILSVVMGTGNPDYDNNGARRGTPDYSWIGAGDWTGLKSGALGFKLIENKAEFEAIASATMPPAKLAGIARSFDATQAYRAGAAPAIETPNSVPRKADVPSLTTMAQGALNILDSDPDGMLLVIEGGGVDRAMHGSNFGRMIEERIEFDEAVAAISAYLDANTAGNNWSNTLVIVTADHDHLLLGPDSDTVPFQDLQDNGSGRLPGYKWQNNSHSNNLVPLYARGQGADMLTACADQRDEFTDARGRKFGRGAYLDQTEIFAVMTGQPCHN